MPTRIKNDQTITETVRAAVAERCDLPRRAGSGRSLVEEITVIAKRCANRPIISQRSDDETLGYDDFGVPAR